MSEFTKEQKQAVKGLIVKRLTVRIGDAMAASKSKFLRKVVALFRGK